MIWAFLPEYGAFILVEEEERKDREEKAEDNSVQNHVGCLRGSLRERGRPYAIHRVNPLFFQSTSVLIDLFLYQLRF